MFLVNFAEDNGMKKIFFCNIPFETTQEELEEYYSAYDVSEVYIPLDSSTGQTRRFASITMPQEEAAKSINGHQWYVLPEPHICHQRTITAWKKGSPP